MSAEPLDPQKAVLLGFGPSSCDSSTAWTAHPLQPVQDFVLPHQQWEQGEDKPPLAPGYLSVFAPSEGSRGLITLSLAVISAESSSLDGQFNQCVCVSSSTHIWKTPGCPQPSGGVTLSPLVVMVPPCSSCFSHTCASSACSRGSGGTRPVVVAEVLLCHHALRAQRPPEGSGLLVASQFPLLLTIQHVYFIGQGISNHREIRGSSDLAVSSKTWHESEAPALVCRSSLQMSTTSHGHWPMNHSLMSH